MSSFPAQWVENLQNQSFMTLSGHELFGRDLVLDSIDAFWFLLSWSLCASTCAPSNHSRGASLLLADDCGGLLCDGAGSHQRTRHRGGSGRTPKGLPRQRRN